MSEWIKRLAEKYSEVNEKQLTPKEISRAAAKGAAMAKPKDQVTLKKPPFEIPEDIPATERTAFHGAAAGAHKAGKSHFTFQGKKYPVTMKKDTAQAIADDVKEAKHEDEADDATVRMMKDNPKMRGQKGPGGMKSLDRKAHSAVRKALQKNEDDEVVMNPKKEKKEKEAAPEAGMQEAVVYKRIVEARKMKATADKGGEHSKGATDPEDWNEKEKNNKGAMDMKKDMAVDTSDKISNYDEKGHNDMEKAGRVGPAAKSRPGDNSKGDKKIIPSATPVKGM